MTADIKQAIEQYFLDNWTDSDKIQFEGVTLDYDNIDNFISLVYNPVLNETYGFDGTNCGRVRYVGIQKIFCYAKNSTLAYRLADLVKTFINGKQLGNIVFDIGNDNMAINTDTGFYEVLVEVDLVDFN